MTNNKCPHCAKNIEPGAIFCPHCEGLIIKDRKGLLKIIEDFELYFASREDPEKFGILLGIPESRLPHKKEIIEQTLEFFMLAYAVEFLRTGSKEAEAKFNNYEIQYLSLADYFPDEDILFYDIVTSQDSDEVKYDQISARLKEPKNIVNFERWTKRMYASEEKYYQKVKAIKAKAEGMKDKMAASGE